MRNLSTPSLGITASDVSVECGTVAMLSTPSLGITKLLIASDNPTGILSTPSLGITLARFYKTGKADELTFNSLSRDHTRGSVPGCNR